jgi:hypothetical protein
VLNEKFPIDQALAYEFVWATLDTKEQQLKIYHNEKNDTTTRLVKTIAYEFNEPITPRTPL